MLRDVMIAMSCREIHGVVVMSGRKFCRGAVMIISREVLQVVMGCHTVP